METTPPSEHGHDHRHGHDLGRFGPLKAAFYAVVHPSGVGNDFVVSLADPTGTDVVLDIGSGPGRAAVQAAKAMRTGKVIGVEPAPNLRRVARVRAWLSGVSGRTEFVDGTAEALPVDDMSVDIVWAVNSLHHWADIERGLAEVTRVLRHGGRFVACDEDFSHGDHPRGSDPHAEWPQVDYDHLTGALNVMGFDAETRRESTDGIPVRVVTATKR